MNDTVATKHHQRPLFYRCMQTVFFLLYRMVFRISWEGMENVPLEGGIILAPNHASTLDPPAIGCILPRMISFIAKKELFTIPFIRQLLLTSQSIPIDRGGYTRDTIKAVISRLKSGSCFIIFPEGTRTKTGAFCPPKKGIGMLAVQADVPVVPCLIEGTFHATPFKSRITIHFLPPFKPSETKAETKKAHYLLVSEKIMCDISSLSKSHYGRA